MQVFLIVIYIYIYIYIEREREREIERDLSIHIQHKSCLLNIFILSVILLFGSLLALRWGDDVLL